MTDQKKVSALFNSDIFVFPSYHGEGMPNSVLKAMAFGLPIIATPVGGLIDVLEDNRTGFFVEIKNVEQIIEKSSIFFDDLILRKSISLHNFQIANENYTTNKVRERVKKIYADIINN